MTTRFEQIVSAFPLHAQRIAEAVYTWDPRNFERWRDSTPEHYENAGWMLCDAFDRYQTPEGFCYWRALASGVGGCARPNIRWTPHAVAATAWCCRCNNWGIVPSLNHVSRSSINPQCYVEVPLML
jgi:hypothetical protein